MFEKLIGSKVSSSAAGVDIKIVDHGFFLKAPSLEIGTKLLVSWRTGKASPYSGDGSEFTHRELEYRPDSRSGMFIRTDGKAVDVTVVKKEDLTEHTTAADLTRRTSRVTDYRVRDSHSDSTPWFNDPLHPANPWGVYGSHFSLSTPLEESSLPPPPREETPPHHFHIEESPPETGHHHGHREEAQSPFATDVTLNEVVSGGTSDLEGGVGTLSGLQTSDLDTEFGDSSKEEVPSENESPFGSASSDSEVEVGSGETGAGPSDTEPSAY